MTQPPEGLRRSAWLEIDLAAIRHNVGIIRRLVGTARVAPVIKAEAYGHGAVPVGVALAEVADALCVATLDEAVALRSRVASRILMLYPTPAHAAQDALMADVELTLMSEADLQALEGVVARVGTTTAVQLCVETGMGRGGLRPEAVAALAARIHGHRRFVLMGLWSHLSTPEDLDVSRRQVERFDAACTAVRAAGVPMPPCHLAASGGIFGQAAPPLDLVRPGLAVYGVLDEDLPVAAAARDAAAQLRPAMSMKARAVAISEIRSGETVGYGGHWRAARSSRVAILPVGYGDGFMRASGSGAVALVRGVRAPLVGVISMDALAVDITDLPTVGGDDEFVLLGSQGPESISVGELARRRNTIAWEVLSSMAGRLDRVYHPRAGPAR